MKKNIFLILFIFYSTVAMPQSVQKNYFIDIDLIIKDDPDFLNTRIRIENQMQSDLNEIQKNKELYLKENKPELNLSALGLQPQNSKYNQMMAELIDQERTIKYYYKKREEELRLPIIKKILNKVTEFGNQKKYPLILEKRSIILYNSSLLEDITQEFIEFNKPKN